MEATQENEMRKKAVRKPKKGKVVRLTPETWRLIRDHKMGGETIDQVIRRLMELPPLKGEAYYVLPNSLLVDKDRAKLLGRAVMMAVAQGRRKIQEKPILVREVPL